MFAGLYTAGLNVTATVILEVTALPSRTAGLNVQVFTARTALDVSEAKWRITFTSPTAPVPLDLLDQVWHKRGYPEKLGDLSPVRKTMSPKEIEAAYAEMKTDVPCEPEHVTFGDLKDVAVT